LGRRKKCGGLAFGELRERLFYIGVGGGEKNLKGRDNRGRVVKGRREPIGGVQALRKEDLRKGENWADRRRMYISVSTGLKEGNLITTT